MLLACGSIASTEKETVEEGSTTKADCAASTMAGAMMETGAPTGRYKVPLVVPPWPSLTATSNSQYVSVAEAGSVKAGVAELALVKIPAAQVVPVLHR
jgi:hypothetical protein